MFGSRFLDNGLTDSEKVYSFGNCYSIAPFSVVQPIRHSCSLAPKWGSGGPTVVYALHKGLIVIFSETTNANSFKIEHDKALDSLYIYTGNDVTRYFRSAENRTTCSFLVKFGSRLLDNGSTDSQSVCSFGNRYSRAAFSLV